MTTEPVLTRPHAPEPHPADPASAHADANESVRIKRGVATGQRKKAQAQKRRRRIWRRIALIVLLPIFLIAAAVGVLMLRLQNGPVQVAWLGPVIEHALGRDAAAQLGGDKVEIEMVELRWSSDRGLIIGLENVRVVESAAGSAVVSVPSIEAQPSWRALLYGQIAAERLDLVSPRLTVVTRPDGSRTLSIARAQPQPSSTSATPPADTQGPSVELGTAIREASARARRRADASAFLRTIGLRNATLIVDHGERKSLWRIPEFSLDLRHRSFGSTITGRATVASQISTWGVDFATVEQADSGAISLAVTVSGLIPRSIARSVPQFALLEALDVPISGTGQFDIDAKGSIRAARMTLAATPGRIFMPWLGRAATRIDGAAFEVEYDGPGRRLSLPKIDLRWDDNRLNLKGEAVAKPDDVSGENWTWQIKALSGQFAGAVPSAPPVQIDELTAQGQFNPTVGRLVLGEMKLKAAGADIKALGDVSEMGQPGRLPRAHLEGETSPMGVDTIAALWPRDTAAGARDWVQRAIKKGRVQRGLFKLATEAVELPDGAENRTRQPGSAPEAGEARLSLTIEAADVELKPVAEAPGVEFPRGLIRVEGQTLEITAPDAFVGPPGPQRINLKAARFSVAGLGSDEQPLGEFAARITGGLAALIDLADREPFRLFKSNGVTLPQIDGRIDGQIKFTLPLGENIQASEIRPDARVRVTDLRTRNLTPGADITAGTISIDTNDRAIDVKGDIQLKGIPARILGQYVLNQPADKQPPIRITTVLDQVDRLALGIDLGDIVLGEVPFEITIGRGERGEVQTRVRGDLTRAELQMQSMAWNKPAGRPATIQFDVHRTKDGRTELAPLRIAGDNIAAEGTITLGPDNKPREYQFPVFTINTVSQLAVNGKLRPDGVWDVRAFGPRFDARDMFRRVLSAAPPSASQGQALPRGVRPQRPIPPKTPDKDVDLTAEIENVLGFGELSLKTVRIQLSRRNDKVLGLDVAGLLESGRPFATVMRPAPDRSGRQILVEALDAGQFMKLIGFYPNAVGGELQAEINIDAAQGTERKGTLWMKNFVVLGDTVVGEVLKTSEDRATPPAGPQARQRTVREQIPFDLLRVPFAVGSGQFVMNNAAIRGPLLGATWAGRVDFQNRTLLVGGTYAPLSGLSGPLGAFPILGQLITGPKGEGILGITFQVSGPMAKPEIIVNPLSLLAPGITREIFQMQPDEFNVIPRTGAGAPAPTRRAPGPRVMLPPQQR